MLVCICKYCFGIKIVPIDKPSKLRKKPPAMNRPKKLSRFMILSMFMGKK